MYGPSFMVDYTERRKTERKKFLYVSNEHYITYGPPQREEVLGEILIIYRGVFLLELFLKYATMNE